MVLERVTDAEDDVAELDAGEATLLERARYEPSISIISYLGLREEWNDSLAAIHGYRTQYGATICGVPVPPPPDTTWGPPQMVLLTAANAAITCTVCRHMIHSECPRAFAFARPDPTRPLAPEMPRSLHFETRDPDWLVAVRAHDRTPPPLPGDRASVTVVLARLGLWLARLICGPRVVSPRSRPW